ncbi:integrase catalytic domain-containing protein [Trichonephila clavipes]|nr:integrase catalytic domain-containing protein [Trichonephila clavipes]
MDAKTAPVLRGRAKAALTRTKNFIDKNDQTFDKSDVRKKLEKLELTYTEFDKADAAFPIEYPEMEEFETKYNETKAKLQNTLENLSVRTNVNNDNSDGFETVSNMKSSNFKVPKINIERFSGKLTDSLNSNLMLNLHINGTNIDNQLREFGSNAESNFDEASDGIKAEQKSDSIFNLFTHTSNDVIHDLFEHYSSITKIIRIFAYCQRFIKNYKKIASSQGSLISSSHFNITSLNFSETKTAEETIIRWVQATKAVHIEAVGDLTTDSFIAALRRFTARRGAPHHIYSDNGTNFVGARRKLDKIRRLWLSLATNEAISNYLSKSSIDWHFLFLPHHHILEVMFFFQYLRSFLQPPTTEIIGSRYRISNGDFGGNEANDYLSSLQPHKKWQDAHPNLKEDDIVLLKDESPPGTWPMTRVLQVHPGSDGLVRVATVKTQDSVFKRPVHKLRKFPIYPN